MSKIGVGVALVHNEKILLGKRGHACARGVGCWALPGGGVEPGESHIAAGIREVLEETGIRIFNVFVFDVSYHKDEDIFVIWLQANLLEEAAATITEPSKCEEWRWMDLPEMWSMVSNHPDQWKWTPLNMWHEKIFKQL